MITSNIDPTSEQMELQRTVRRFLADSKDGRPDKRDTTGLNRAIWQQMGQRLGLQGLLIPEAHGGSGSGWLEPVLVQIELGRALSTVPYLSTAILGVSALIDAENDEINADLFPRIADGSNVIALAYIDDGVGTMAHPAGAGWSVSGSMRYVISAADADPLLVVAAFEDGAKMLFLVDPKASGVHRTSLETLDLTGSQSHIELQNVPALLVGHAKMDRLLATGSIAIAADALGGAERCLEMSVEYAKTRYQFGRPIGSFQAIKHPCADMLVAIEGARSLLFAAAQQMTLESDDASVAVSLAKAACCQAYANAASTTIQIHGGLGYTWDHDAHLYFRRAWSDMVLFGDPSHHYDQVASHLGM